MALKDIFKITKQTKILLIFLVCISSIGFAIAYFYYDNVNKSEDPRVYEARKMLIQYDNLMKELKYLETFPILDSIYNVFNSTPGYEGSYEFGVIYNNRASVYISMALYDSLISKDEKDNMLRIAEENVMKSINVYNHWIDSVGKMSDNDIQKMVELSFNSQKQAFEGKNIQNIINKHIEDLIFAKIETPRRLSVSYTNLGIIQRHQLKTEEALLSYTKAITIWKDNFAARSNLNVLMGKAPEDRSIIDKLFPPDRKKVD